ncbi:MAG: redoxin domain-containing protein, partial [Candidatus Nanopelagicales bacterium]
PHHALRAFAEKENIKTILLSDFWPHGAVAKEYGVFLEDLGFANRGTFLIDKSGIVRWKTITSPGEARVSEEYKKALAAIS